jgi:hypothetical protein
MFSIQSFLTWQSKLLMTYKHLSQAERYQIYALMKAGHDQSQIAKSKPVTQGHGFGVGLGRQAVRAWRKND